MQSKPDYVFGICRRTEKMIGLQIGDYCHGWSLWEHQIDE